MHNNFHKIIKAVGTGVKHNHNLTQLQMEESAIAILKGEVYPEQISAFLLGWRMKPETVEEFKGVLDGFDKFIKKTPIDNSIEMGYPYDGKVNNPYMFSLISKYIKEFDLNISSVSKGITAKLLESQDKIIVVASDVPKIIFDHWRWKEKVERWKAKDDHMAREKEVSKTVKFIFKKIDKLAENLK